MSETGTYGVNHPPWPAGADVFAADVPTVLDVRCDIEVPPIPPHANIETQVDDRSDRNPGTSSPTA
jgi:hypothetical protein